MKRKPGRPKVKQKVKFVRLTVYPETRDRIKVRAEREGKSMAQWIDEVSKR